MSRENEKATITTEEKKRVIADFLEYMDRNDAEILASAKDFAGVIKALSGVHISNGLIGELVKNGKGFIAELEDPRVCWKHLESLESRAEPAFDDLKKDLESRVSILLAAVGGKNIPDWFWELLQDPHVILPDYREFLRQKAKAIMVVLSGGNNAYAENCPRTYERPIPPPQGKLPCKKGG